MPARTMKKIYECNNPQCQKGGPVLDENGNQLLDENGNPVYKKGRWLQTGNNNLYCSKQCSGVARRGKPLSIEALNRREMNKLVRSRSRFCAKCGKPFEAPAHYLAKKFCSPECVSADKKEREYPTLQNKREKRQKVGLV